MAILNFSFFHHLVFPLRASFFAALPRLVRIALLVSFNKYFGKSLSVPMALLFSFYHSGFSQDRPENGHAKGYRNGEKKILL